MSKSSDVIIVGGGIIGLTIALRLRQQAVAVSVFDRGEPGQEASWAAAGLVAPKFEPATEPFAQLAIASRDMYATFCDELKEMTGIDAEYRADGTLMPILDSAEESFMNEVVTSAGDSVPLFSLSPQEVRDLEPDISPEVRCGLRIPGDHQVNNRKLMQALKVAVASAGAVIQAHQPVRAIRLRAGKVSHIETDTGRHAAGNIVLAAGCWSHLVEIDDANLQPPTHPVKGQMVAVQAGEWVNLTRNIHSPRCYLVPRRDRRVEIGSTVENVGFDKSVTAGGIGRLLHAAISVVPKLRDCPVIETWAGLRPGSPDLHPIVGKTWVEGLFMATGNYRSGLLMAPITGELMTELILTGVTPALLQPFPLERFRADATRGGNT